MIEDAEIGAFVRVYDASGFVAVELDDEPRLDAAVSAYLDNGRDRLVRMARIDGDEYVILASEVTGWMVSTPEGRRRSTELDKASKDEEEANRQAVGLWDADD